MKKPPPNKRLDWRDQYLSYKAWQDRTLMVKPLNASAMALSIDDLAALFPLSNRHI